LLQMQIEYKNWLDLSQTDVSREVALWTARVYKDISEMVGQIAEQEGYNVVLYHEQFTPRGSDPQTIREQIANRKVIYVSPSADLSQLVLDALNAKYRSEPRRKMLDLQSSPGP
jgi:Skp family chaperone for outer membrane proteins